MKEFDPIYEIKQAHETVASLGLPAHLESAAFDYLLRTPFAGQKAVERHSITAQARLDQTSTSDLRAFTSSISMKGAVAEIPALLYWARVNEGKDTVNERDVIELYRRAGMRPPKDVAQSFRDLCKRKYFRLESVSGDRGSYRLSRAGEDFVLHDLMPKAA